MGKSRKRLLDCTPPHNELRPNDLSKKKCIFNHSHTASDVDNWKQCYVVIQPLYLEQIHCGKINRGEPCDVNTKNPPTKRKRSPSNSNGAIPPCIRTRRLPEKISNNKIDTDSTRNVQDQNCNSAAKRNPNLTSSSNVERNKKSTSIYKCSQACKKRKCASKATERNVPKRLALPPDVFKFVFEKFVPAKKIAVHNTHLGNLYLNELKNIQKPGTSVDMETGSRLNSSESCKTGSTACFPHQLEKSKKSPSEVPPSDSSKNEGVETENSNVFTPHKKHVCVSTENELKSNETSPDDATCVSLDNASSTDTHGKKNVHPSTSEEKDMLVSDDVGGEEVPDDEEVQDDLCESKQQTSDELEDESRKSWSKELPSPQESTRNVCEEKDGARLKAIYNSHTHTADDSVCVPLHEEMRESSTLDEKNSDTHSKSVCVPSLTSDELDERNGQVSSEEERREQVSDHDENEKGEEIQSTLDLQSTDLDKTGSEELDSENKLNEDQTVERDEEVERNAGGNGLDLLVCVEKNINSEQHDTTEDSNQPPGELVREEENVYSEEPQEVYSVGPYPNEHNYIVECNIYEKEEGEASIYINEVSARPHDKNEKSLLGDELQPSGTLGSPSSFSPNDFTSTESLIVNSESIDRTFTHNQTNCTQNYEAGSNEESNNTSLNITEIEIVYQEHLPSSEEEICAVGNEHTSITAASSDVFSENDSQHSKAKENYLLDLPDPQVRRDLIDVHRETISPIIETQSSEPSSCSTKTSSDIYQDEHDISSTTHTHDRINKLSDDNLASGSSCSSMWCKDDRESSLSESGNCLDRSTSKKNYTETHCDSSYNVDRDEDEEKLEHDSSSEEMEDNGGRNVVANCKTYNTNLCELKKNHYSLTSAVEVGTENRSGNIYPASSINTHKDDSFSVRKEIGSSSSTYFMDTFFSQNSRTHSLFCPRFDNYQQDELLDPNDIKKEILDDDDVYESISDSSDNLNSTVTEKDRDSNIDDNNEKLMSVLQYMTHGSSYECNKTSTELHNSAGLNTQNVSTVSAHPTQLGDNLKYVFPGIHTASMTNSSRRCDMNSGRVKSCNVRNVPVARLIREVSSSKH